jgi:uncharacterized membrane protein (DUF485 family)
MIGATQTPTCAYDLSRISGQKAGIYDQGRMSLQAFSDQSSAPEFEHKNRTRGRIMATPDVVDWDAIIRDPRFQSLARRKSRFLWGLMFIAVAYYLLLPIGAAYFQDFFKIRVWGVVNVALLFALSQFVMAWVIALVYSRKASRDFDHMAAELSAQFAGVAEPVEALPPMAAASVQS